MSPLEQAKSWLLDEKPSSEEIQQSVDNLCHQIARPPKDVGKEQLLAAITFLMGALGKDPSEVVLPESPPRAELDLSPLGESDGDLTPPLSASERRKRFEELKLELRAPF